MRPVMFRVLKINIVWLFIVCTFLPKQAVANEQEQKIDKYFATLYDDPVQLRLFLQKMPKGADLHTHFDGAVYAESYLQWAAQDGKCFDLERLAIVTSCEQGNTNIISAREVVDDAQLLNMAIDALSVRNYRLGDKSGHQQFFSTFQRFSAAISGREGHMLAEIAQRAARQKISMLELQVVFGIIEAASLATEFVEKNPSEQVNLATHHPALIGARQRAITQLDHAEAVMRTLLKCDSQTPEIGCNVKISYLSTIIRVLPEGSIAPQAALAFSLVDSDKRFVGVNIAAPEDNLKALRDYKTHMELLRLFGEKYPKVANKLSLHAGELTLGLVRPQHLSDNIYDAVSIANAKRIGHGVSIVHELNKHENLLETLKDESVLIEINLSSNEVILDVSHEDHPLALYLANGIPVSLSTDDEGISRIDLTHEYQIATQRYQLSYTTLKSFARNSIEYSFLDGQSLYDNYSDLTKEQSCKKTTDFEVTENHDCIQFLAENEKANYQSQLEAAFTKFEKSIIQDLVD